MTWILAIAGTLLSLFLGGLTNDHYYQGVCHGGAIIGAVWLGVYFLSRLQLQAWQVILAGLGGLLFYQSQQPTIVVPGAAAAAQKSKRLLPWPKDRQATSIEGFVEGDAIGPGGVEATCDLPVSMRMHNTGGNDIARDPRSGRPTNPMREPGKGSGLCVFTSVEHAARWQQEKRLFGFQEKMTHEPGGGSPKKVDDMIAKYGPGTPYVQHTAGNDAFLELALKTDRMPGITYAGRDSRYAMTIAHMVNLVYLDEHVACILDNNFPDKLLWMPRKDLLDRWRDNGGGWSVVLLSSPPSPPPFNWGHQ